MSRGYPIEQWVGWIEEQKTSGLTVAAFCESIGVSQNAFYVRRRKLAKQMSERRASFVSLEVSGAAAVSVDLPCGATVRVHDQNSIATVLSALVSCEASS